MDASIISLYAKAVTFKPVFAKTTSPKLPNYTRQKSISVVPSHFSAYNKLINWQTRDEQIVHPNYIQTLSLSMQLDMMVQDTFPFKPLGLVHIGNQIKVRQSPRVFDQLALVTEFGEIYFHKRGWLFEVITKAFIKNRPNEINPNDMNAEPDVIGTSLYLARTTHNKDNFDLVSTNVSEIPAWLKANQNQLLDSLGQSDKIASFEFQSDVGRKYAKVSGDYNPIHLHPFTAKILGFKKAIAHGMYSKAIVISEMQNQSLIRSEQFEINTVFSQPIALPTKVDMLCHKGEVQSQNIFKLASNCRNKLRIHLSGEVNQF